MFKRIITSFAAIIATAAAFISAKPAMAEEMPGPVEIVQQTADKLFPKLQKLYNEKKLTAENAMPLVLEDLIPHVDVKYAAYKVLGSHIKSTNEAQRERFVKAFQTYLIDTYSIAATKFADQKFEVLKRAVGDEKSTTVEVKLTDSQGVVYNAAFKFRKNTKTGEWKAYDMVAEGISLLSSKQTEFGELISKHGFDAVCQMLEEHEVQEEDSEDESDK